jgi:hypothetical protein
MVEVAPAILSRGPAGCESPESFIEQCKTDPTPSAGTGGRDARRKSSFETNCIQARPVGAGRLQCRDDRNLHQQRANRQQNILRSVLGASLSNVSERALQASKAARQTPSRSPAESLSEILFDRDLQNRAQTVMGFTRTPRRARAPGNLPAAEVKRVPRGFTMLPSNRGGNSDSRRELSLNVKFGDEELWPPSTLSAEGSNTLEKHRFRSLKPGK